MLKPYQQLLNSLDEKESSECLSPVYYFLKGIGNSCDTNWSSESIKFNKNLLATRRGRPFELEEGHPPRAPPTPRADPKAGRGSSGGRRQLALCPARRVRLLVRKRRVGRVLRA